MHETTNLLKNNEKILWNGGPNQNIWLTSVDIAPIFLSLVFFCVGIILFAGSPSHAPANVDIDWYLTFWGIPMITIVCSGTVLIKTLIINQLKKRKMLYIITNKRILIVNKKDHQKVRELPLSALCHMDLTDNGKYGHIVFYRRKLLPIHDATSSKFSSRGPLAFWDIIDVNKVYNVVQSSLSSSSESPASSAELASVSKSRSAEPMSAN